MTTTLDTTAKIRELNDKCRQAWGAYPNCRIMLTVGIRSYRLRINQPFVKRCRLSRASPRTTTRIKNMTSEALSKTATRFFGNSTTTTALANLVQKTPPTRQKQRAF